jgi:N4-gp56 family major capsid protein
MPTIDVGTMTTTTTLTNTIKSYYDRMLLEQLNPQTRFYQFGVKKPLPTGEGTSVIWNRPRRLGFGQKVTAGIKPSANALSTIKVSSLIEVYGGYTALEDTVQLTSISDVLDLATMELAIQAAETLDRAVAHAIIYFDDPDTATSAVHIGKTSADLIISADSIVPAVYSTALIAVSDIRKSVGELRRRNAVPFDGQNFIGIMHTVVAEDLRADSTWQNWHQYVTPENLYAGEIGRVEGARFVETTLAPVSAGSGNGYAISAAGATSAMAYGTVIFGRGFYGVTELNGGIKTFLSQGADKFDPLNQTTTYGWKAHFAAKVLNVSAGLVLWTGSGDVITETSSLSAREGAGLTLSAIPTAT